MDAVHHLVGDHVIHDPIRPVLDLVADAYLPIAWPTLAAAPQTRLHVAYPPYGIPLDFPIEVFPVDELGAPLQVSVIAALMHRHVFIQLSTDRFEHGAN